MMGANRCLVEAGAGAILCWCAAAQGLYQLAATDDGAVMYLATPMRQRNTLQPLATKVFVLDAAGLRLHNNAAWESSPDVSGDGRTLGIAVPGPPCTPTYPGYRNCYDVPYVVTNITGLSAGPMTVPGTIRFSQNGMYALQVTRATSFDCLALWNLQTGQRSFPGICSASFTRFGRPVANDGTIVAGGYSLYLQRVGEDHRTLLDTLGAHEPAIDAGGSTVVYTRVSLSPGDFDRIMIVRLVGNSVKTLVEGYGDCFQPVISNDGTRVLFVSTAAFDGSKTTSLPQAFIIGADGSGLRQLTHDPAGVEYAVLTGNGRAAIVLSRTGRVQRVDVVSGQIADLIPRTLMVVDNFYFGCVAGSICRLKGVGFTESRMSASGVPLPRQLGDFALRLNGTPVPLLWAYPDEVAFQMPWEASGDQAVEFGTNTTFAFEPFPIKLGAANYGYAFWPLPPPYDRSNFGSPLTIAAHQTFDALVLPENPARPGEIVHLYATALGPVAPAVATGQPAPSDPLSWVVDPLACRIGDIPVPVLYQGLAPGTVGIYQVSVGLPSPIQTPFLTANEVLQFACHNSHNWYYVQLPFRNAPN